MTEGSAKTGGVEVAGGNAAPAPDSRIEQWYRERCTAISDICIVRRGTDRHAVVVPNFELLREQRHPNTRELIRFEFHSASKLIAAEERPDSFSVQSAPLVRVGHGDMDRERSGWELLVTAFPALATAEGGDNAIASGVRSCIRQFRPDVGTLNEANLELDLGFDSLDRILLIASVEKSFGITFSESEAAGIFTVGDLIDAVQSHGHDSDFNSRVSWSELLAHRLNPMEQSLADSILKQRPVLTMLAWSGAQAVRRLWRRRFRFAVTGTEHLPTQGSWLLAANHCSHLDPLFLAWALPYRIATRLSFMGHTEYFGAGWKSAVARRLKLVPVDPDEHALRGLRLCAEALRRGFGGAIFPEGERSPNGAQQRFHRGIAVLAREMNVPIVPTAICGSYEVLPRGRERIVPGPVQVHFGDALHAEAGEAEQDLLSRAWTAVAQLRGADAQAREPMPLPMDLAPITQ